jgi:hypothetical protein
LASKWPIELVPGMGQLCGERCLDQQPDYGEES